MQALIAILIYDVIFSPAKTGDKLLMRDVLRAPPASWPTNQTISFNYSVSESITYIEIGSENVRGIF